MKRVILGLAIILALTVFPVWIICSHIGKSSTKQDIPTHSTPSNTSDQLKSISQETHSLNTIQKDLSVPNAHKTGEIVKEVDFSNETSTCLFNDNEIFGSVGEELVRALEQLSKNGYNDVYLQINVNDGLILGGDTSSTANPDFNIISFLHEIKEGPLGQWQMPSLALAEIKQRYGKPLETKTDHLASGYQLMRITWHVYDTVWLGAEGESEKITWMRIFPNKRK